MPCPWSRAIATWSALVFILALALGSEGHSQIPETFKNLQYFPKDATRADLVQRMREFSFALGVRCQHCHAGGDGVSFVGVQFESDEKPAKRKARFMLRMTDRLNDAILAEVPERRTPPIRLDCVHCHRGSPTPRTLASELAGIIEADGPQAAVERYRTLRSNMASGRFDLSEWSVNDLARALAADGKTDAALAMLEMNAEYYPDSSAIDMQLGQLHQRRGERDKAIARYRLALKKQPDHQGARQALAALEDKR